MVSANPIILSLEEIQALFFRLKKHEDPLNLSFKESDCTPQTTLRIHVSSTLTLVHDTMFRPIARKIVGEHESVSCD